MLPRHLNAIAERCPFKIEIDLHGVSDMLMALVEGGIILSKTLKDRKALPAQITRFRSDVRLAFEPSAG